MTTESFSPDMKYVHNLAQRLVQLIDKHLASLEPISGENDAALLAILIRSLTTFKVILQLLRFSYAGSACMVLARTIVESMVGVMFMELKGMDKMLLRFRLFEIAEAKEDIDYLSYRGVDVSKLEPAKINKEYKKNKKLFERKPGERWRSWAHTHFEGMLDELLKSGRFSKKNIERVLRTYIQGNRNTHLSPSDTKLYVLGEVVLKTMSIRDSRLALVAGMSSLLRIAIIFSERIGDKSFKDKLNKIFLELDNDG
ncbi:hypothetical protein IH980_02480 [Patescibacteria group bacterium]|nr:hypothetical protein [Patescibacteria group bacterium]